MYLTGRHSWGLPSLLMYSKTIIGTRRRYRSTPRNICTISNNTGLPSFTRSIREVFSFFVHIPSFFSYLPSLLHYARFFHRTGFRPPRSRSYPDYRHTQSPRKSFTYPNGRRYPKTASCPIADHTKTRTASCCNEARTTPYSRKKRTPRGEYFQFLRNWHSPEPLPENKAAIPPRSSEGTDPCYGDRRIQRDRKEYDRCSVCR